MTWRRLDPAAICEFVAAAGAAVAVGCAAMAIYDAAQPAPAHAQSSLCFDRARLVASLGADYGERLVARGLSPSGDIVIELYASADRSTWSIAMVDTTGRACLKAAGRDWESLDVPAPAEGSTSPPGEQTQ